MYAEGYQHLYNSVAMIAYDLGKVSQDEEPDLRETEWQVPEGGPAPNLQERLHAGFGETLGYCCCDGQGRRSEEGNRTRYPRQPLGLCIPARQGTSGVEATEGFFLCWKPASKLLRGLVGERLHGRGTDYHEEFCREIAVLRLMVTPHEGVVSAMPVTRATLG